jgi:hypothetical protein
MKPGAVQGLNAGSHRVKRLHLKSVVDGPLSDFGEWFGKALEDVVAG